MTLTTRPLTPRFGVEVLDLDLNRADLAAVFPAIRAAFDAHSALLFRGQPLAPAVHLGLARLFGPIEDRQADERAPGAAFKIPEVSNIRADGSVTGAQDLHTLQLQSNMLWHCDSTFMPVPALSNILTAHTVTTTGGATELASTRAAFGDMPAEQQHMLRSLRLHHHYAHSRAQISPDLAAQPMFHKWPAQTWPAIWTNPANGDEAVYVASHAYGVEGMSEPDGQALIRDLIATCTQPAYVYSHNWRVGDVLIWDQRAVLHRGTPWPYDQPRRLTSICSSVTAADGLTAMQGHP